jgi:predicted NUDIX family NTP pyrophosphohydrolase
MANWYAGCIIYRKVDGVVEYLVIDTKSLHPSFLGRSKVQTKFVGGTEDGHAEEDKDIIGTRDRELFEETHMRIKGGDNPLVIHTETLPGHVKVFYLIPFEVLEGELRTEEKTIDFDWMSPPYWMDRYALAHALYKSHQSAFIKAIARVERGI